MASDDISADQAASRAGPSWRRRDAALIVQFALSEGADLPLADLPSATQARLAEEMSSLGMVERDRLEGAALAFAEALDGVALAAPASLDDALRLLDGRISPSVIARLRRDHDLRAGADPWPRVTALPAEDLVRIMESEATEVCAVLLSKLPVARAADLLGRLPGPRARQVSGAVSLTREVTPAAVRRIGAGLAESYAAAADPAFDEKPERRLAAILNSSRSETRDQVLEALAAEAPDFATQVRRTIFTFADIPSRLKREDVSKIVRLVETSDLVTACSAALQMDDGARDAADYLLENISRRMAAQLRDDIEERPTPSRKAAEAAIVAVISAIRSAADKGEIALHSPEDEEGG